MSNFVQTTLIVLLGLFISATALNAQVFVHGNATGKNNGTSWTDAYTDLQTAIDAATEGETLWVAAGVYQPNRCAKKSINQTSSRLKSIYSLFIH